MKVYDAYYVPPRCDTQVFSEKFQTLIKINRCILSEQETTYSTVFFHFFNRFLFPDAEKGCIFHQPVLHKDRHGHSNKPDGYIAKLKSGVPSIPILVTDFKKTDFKKALSESLGYFQSISTLSKLHEPMLVMPSTPTKLTP